MIYIDPPYGVKFGSNFQPFVRKRDVKHGGDEDMTREPEMVKAYRDTWELGLHSYLTYLRDRLMVARELLHESGSVFLQISDDNVHIVRNIMDEVFGTENFCSQISFAKSAGQTNDLISTVSDFILWYSRNRRRVKFRSLYREKSVELGGTQGYDWVMLPDERQRRLSGDEKRAVKQIIESGGRIFKADNLTSSEARPTTTVPYEYEGKTFHPGVNRHWRVVPALLDELARHKRLLAVGNTLAYVQFANDFPYVEVPNLWDDTSIAGFAANVMGVPPALPGWQ
jgi:adenine-specific DNA-methyltransferase